MLPAIVMLHGANGRGQAIRGLVEALAPLQVLSPDLLGHGGRPVPERLSAAEMAADVVASMDRAGIRRAVVGGYSVGGYVALYVARHYPERVAGVVTLATKWVFDERTVAHLTHLADPERLSRPGNPRAAQLEATHQPQDWRRVTEANRQLFRDFGAHPPLTEQELRAIGKPALVLSSEDDQLVPRDEAVALGKLLGCQAMLMPGQCHPLSAVPLPVVGKAIKSWLATRLVPLWQQLR
jgi:pimeloyl-ACP methyl ester carboxylesterase